MKKIKHIFNLIMLILIAYFLYNINFKDILLKNIDLKGSIMLVCLTLLSTVFLSLVFKFELNSFRISLPFKHYFGLTTTNTLYNYILPLRGGLAARAFFLKKVYSFTYLNYTSMLTGSTIISFLVASITAIISSVALHYFGNENRIDFIFLSILSFIFTIGIIVLSNNITILNRFIKWKKVLDVLTGIQIGFKRYKNNKKILVTLILVHVLYITVMSLRLYFVFVIFNIEVGFLTIMLIRSLVVFSMVISITPGNFGISEGIIGLLAFKTGIDLDIAFSIAAFDRVFSILVNVLLGMFFHLLLIREVK